jgi:hypothetical protein
MTRIAATALGALLLSSVAATETRAAGRPVVVVKFSITSPTVIDALGGSDTSKAAVETALSELLGSQLGGHFKFLDWQSAHAAPVAADTPQLIARLVDDSTASMPPVSVHWVAIFPSQAEETLGLAQMPIYKRSDPNIATDAAGLINDVSEQFSALVPTPGFREETLRQFVSRVPLARQVTPIAAKRILELLVTADLPIGMASVMEVEFKRTSPNAEQGLIELSRFAPMESGNLGAGVDSAHVNQTVLQLTDNWHTTLPDLLDGAAVQCFLVDYKPDRSSSPVIRSPE